MSVGALILSLLAVAACDTPEVDRCIQACRRMPSLPCKTTEIWDDSLHKHTVWYRDSYTNDAGMTYYFGGDNCGP